jgi:paraquat-inducible protein B
VEFKGIKVGVVKNIRLAYDARDTSFKIPVLVEIEPGRFLSDQEMAVHSPEKALGTLIDHGLRARLQTGSFLTGQLFVELDMHPDTIAHLLGQDGVLPEIPTIPADLAQMTTAVKNILANLEKLDIDRIGATLLKTLKGANQVVKGAEKLINQKDLDRAVDDFTASLTLLKTILGKMDQRIDPIATDLEHAIRAGHQALEKTRDTLDLVDGVIRPDSPLQYRFMALTNELSSMARSIRVLVDMLERQPNALIFGKTPPPGKERP